MLDATNTRRRVSDNRDIDKVVDPVKLKGGSKRVFDLIRDGWIPSVNHRIRRAFLTKGKEFKPVRYRHMVKAQRYIDLFIDEPAPKRRIITSW